MNVSDFYKYIEQAELLNASTVAELQEVLEVYPYFQTAHILYLKSLYNQNNFKFNEQLKFSSVHINNRKKLLFYLKEKSRINESSVEKKSSVNNSENTIAISSFRETKPKAEQKTIENNNIGLNISSESNKTKETNNKLSKLILSEKTSENTSEMDLKNPIKEEAANDTVPNKTSESSPLIAQVLESLKHKESQEESEPLEENNTKIAEELSQDSLKITALEHDKIINGTPQKEETITIISEEKVLDEEIIIESKAVEYFEETKPQIEKKESIEIESKKLNKNPKTEVALSPQEIIQRRIDEIKLSKVKEDKKKINPIEVHEKTVPKTDPRPIKNSQLLPKDSESIKEVKNLAKEIKTGSNQKTKDENDILAEISEMIAIPAPSNYFLSENKTIENKPISIEQADNNNEKHSFSDWLNQFSKIKEKKNTAHKIPQEHSVEKSKKPSDSLNLKKKNHLIESFLADTKSKVIKPNRNPKVISEKQTIASNKAKEVNLMTETLAQIYIQQTYYDKAIEAYRKLSLKYPKKNTYFASQIEKIKKLQLNS